MESQPQIQPLAPEPKKRRHRIKKLIIKRKDDFLTALEKNWRDWSLLPITKIFRMLGITANQITYAGFALAGIAIWMYFNGYSYKLQLFVLILAVITDLLDGSTARNNDNVTVLGTWLDHIRDGVLVLWATYIIYINKLLSLEMISIIWALQFLLLWITLKDFAFRYIKELSNEEQKVLVNDFSLDNLQASILGRIQFTCWTTGYGLFFLYLIWPKYQLINIGHAFIILEIIFVAMNILESYRKSLPKIGIHNK